VKSLKEQPNRPEEANAFAFVFGFVPFNFESAPKFALKGDFCFCFPHRHKSIQGSKNNGALRQIRCAPMDRKDVSANKRNVSPNFLEKTGKISDRREGILLFIANV
jgi:hypothetical protein